ncbi:MAG: class SAM-dependent methyltransferase [Mucilaginibacter sp.]|nr:class SAM-dependent methyltransferase [Mucilaginibacter sp.]
MEIQNCRICGDVFTAKFVFREMMFGMRDEFGYGECSNCGCIQILEVPHDIEKYYPDYYVSFTQEVPELKRLPFLKRIANAQRIKRKYKNLDDHTLELLKPIALVPGAKILDIGCGRGGLICNLFNLGFEHVTGVDKFISQPIDYGHNVMVLKKELSELQSDAYDLLIMHHVLEHIDDQVNELKECFRLLKKGGVLLVAIPVIGTAWDIYKENWVQLDAPRHFVLHTIKSINILAEKTGFKIGHTVFDSNAFQFWGSELYKKDIPLTLPDTHEWYPVERGFTAEQLSKFDEEARVLNENKKGDAARFYLYKK